MTAKQFRAALETLGLNQSGAARVLGKSLRAVNGYANGDPIPKLVAWMVMYQLTEAESAQSNKPASAGQQK
jgi:hypothetical protein